MRKKEKTGFVLVETVTVMLCRFENGAEYVRFSTSYGAPNSNPVHNVHVLWTTWRKVQFTAQCNLVQGTKSQGIGLEHPLVSPRAPDIPARHPRPGLG